MPTEGERRSAEEMRALLPELLPCPACGYPSLLVTKPVMLVAHREVGECTLWGTPMLLDGQVAHCNQAACRWSGALGEARAKADGVSDR